MLNAIWHLPHTDPGRNSNAQIHGQRPIKERFISEFTAGLAAELELLINEAVYVDMNSLRGGDFYNQALANALRQSATMIVVYQPNYFDSQHPYCAREYRAMASLERNRLALLPNPEDREHSLIIPVFQGSCWEIY